MASSMIFKNRSFTLIEIVIVLIVFIIGIGIFASSYINLVKQYIINQRLQASVGNLRLALEKVWRDIKYGVNFTTSNNSITFKRSYDCKEIKLNLASDTLFYVFNNVTSTLTDPSIIKIDSFSVYASGSESSASEYNKQAPKLITLAIKGKAKMQNFDIPLNFQISVAPINSVFPASPCP